MGALSRIRKQRQFWLLSAFFLAWVIVFAYVPMAGLVVSVLEYRPGLSLAQSAFVGMRHFRAFFGSADFAMVLRNTLAISGLGILFGFPAPIILALLLSEVRFPRFKKLTQTVSYLPYFISWVVTAGFVFALFGNEGIANTFLVRAGAIEAPIRFLSYGPYFWWMLTFVNIWKGAGWSSIIYLSAIAGIDEELYAAGAVDGLGRAGMVRHITLPGIAPTMLLLFILGIGYILNAGFEQQLLLGNPQTRAYYEVLDTYAYKYGIQLGRYSYATAVGLFKSVIGLTLVLSANAVSKKIFDLSII
jgi:putative aldouronate transport system permease protein